MRYPKKAYTFSVDYFSTPESVDPILTVGLLTRFSSQIKARVP
ncbi:hypothetical protein LCACRF28_1851 [Lacticaseibacillus paracasei]|nr:hypothetical protein LCACRF28_1851 [Lacticaseibacillus paracasei]